MMNLPRLTWLAIFVVLGGAAGARGQTADWPAVGDRQVRVWLSVVPHPALGEPLVRQALERLRRKLSLVFTEVAPEVTPAPDAVRGWLIAHPLEDATAERFRQWGCDTHQKTIVVDLRFERGTWRLSGVEHDGYFDLVSAVRRGDIVQRELVAEQTAAWALRCYAPVGVITQPENDVYLADFALADRLRQVSDWRGLDVGAVLQIYREQVQAAPGGPSAIVQTPRDDQFLVVSEVRGATFAARLSVPGHVADQQYFAPLTNPAAGAARYLVRCADTAPGVCRVRVLTDGSEAAGGKGLKSPREGCAVYLAKTRPSRQDLERPLGTTDDRGEFSLEAPSGLQYVVVVYGAAMYYRPFVPGCSPSTVEFLVPFKSPRLDFGETLNRLGDNLRDRRSRFSDVLKRLLKTVAAADVAATEKLVKEGSKLADADDLRDELAKLKKDADDAKHDLEPGYGQLAQQFDGFAKEVADSSLRKAVAQAEVQGLRGRINELWKDKRAWMELQQKTDRLVVLEPADEIAVKRKAWLDGVLRVENAPHSEARRAVDQAASASDSAQFVQDWTKLHAALKRLVDREDLWLLRANDALEKWGDLLTAEQKRLDQEIANFDAVDRKADKERLEKRQQELKDVVKQLNEIDERLQDAIKKMLKKAPQ